MLWFGQTTCIVLLVVCCGSFAGGQQQQQHQTPPHFIPDRPGLLRKHAQSRQQQQRQPQPQQPRQQKQHDALLTVSQDTSNNDPDTVEFVETPSGAKSGGRHSHHHYDGNYGVTTTTIYTHDKKKEKTTTTTRRMRRRKLQGDIFSMTPEEMQELQESINEITTRPQFRNGSGTTFFDQSEFFVGGEEGTCYQTRPGFPCSPRPPGLFGGTGGSDIANQTTTAPSMAPVIADTPAPAMVTTSPIVVMTGAPTPQPTGAPISLVTPVPTTAAPDTPAPTTAAPIAIVTPAPTTLAPIAADTPAPTTAAPIAIVTPAPTTLAPIAADTPAPTTAAPIAADTPAPTTLAPSVADTPAPTLTTLAPSVADTPAPTTLAPIVADTPAPTTVVDTPAPTTVPETGAPTNTPISMGPPPVAPITAAPILTPAPVEAPSSLPTFLGQETEAPVLPPIPPSPGFPVCEICGPGMRITNNNVIIEIAGQDPVSCLALERAGLLGFVEEQFCPIIVPFIGACGCLPQGEAASAPNTMIQLETLVPTGAPSPGTQGAPPKETLVPTGVPSTGTTAPSMSPVTPAPSGAGPVEPPIPEFVTTAAPTVVVPETLAPSAAEGESGGNNIEVNWFIPQEATLPPLTAFVGDTITFNWVGLHNVYIHPSGDCSEDNRVLVGETTGAQYTVIEEDSGSEILFACDIGGHCEVGMRLTLTVESTDGGGGGPTPEAPSSVMAPSSMPSVMAQPTVPGPGDAPSPVGSPVEKLPPQFNAPSEGGTGGAKVVNDPVQQPVLNRFVVSNRVGLVSAQLNTFIDERFELNDAYNRLAESSLAAVVDASAEAMQYRWHSGGTDSFVETPCPATAPEGSVCHEASASFVLILDPGRLSIEEASAEAGGIVQQAIDAGDLQCALDDINAVSRVRIETGDGCSNPTTTNNRR